MSAHHRDPAKYTAYVLWLIGYFYSAIGKVLQFKRSQVGGMTQRSEYARISDMRREQRAALLKKLEEIRIEDGRSIDGGILDHVRFAVLD